MTPRWARARPEQLDRPFDPQNERVLCPLIIAGLAVVDIGQREAAEHAVLGHELHELSCAHTLVLRHQNARWERWGQTCAAFDRASNGPAFTGSQCALAVGSGRCSSGVRALPWREPDGGMAGLWH